MVVGVPEVVLFVLLGLIPLASVWCWADAWKRHRNGLPLVRAAQCDTVPWGLIDLILVVILIAVIVGGSLTVMRALAGIEDSSTLSQLPPEDQAVFFATFGTSTLVATALCFAFLRLRWKASVAELGFNVSQLGNDLLLGLRWFSMLIIPVISVQFLLTRWFPTQHPLIEMIRQSGNSSLLLIAAYAAVVTAPIFEESFFRLFLQGWLEKLQITIIRNNLGLASHEDRHAVLVGGVTSGQIESAVITPVATTTVIDVAGSPVEPQHAEGQNPHATNPQSATADEQQTPTYFDNRKVIWIPILVSSALFSLAHYSHGPDWIPLFFLALGLGYLFQRTRRIQPCIIVHMLVNALGILQLWSAVRQGP